MTKQVFSTSTETLDLRPFLTGIFYHKGQSFPAVRVTPENIGLLCLEFDAELRAYDNGNPYFGFHAKREEFNRHVTVTLADWIFPRGDELHVWPNPIFEATFRVSPGGEFLMVAREREMKEYAMRDAKATAEQFGTNQAWEESELHETLASDEARKNFHIDRLEQDAKLMPTDEWYGKIDPKFHIEETVTYTHEDFTEHVQVEGYVLQDDGTLRYKVRWPNGATSHELEVMLSRLAKLDPKPDAVFQVNEEVIIAETRERGHVLEVYEDDRYRVRLLEGEFKGSKYMFSAAQLEQAGTIMPSAEKIEGDLSE